MSEPQQIAAGDLPRRVLDSLFEGCQVIGPDFRYLYVNEAAARHGRTTREQLLGRTMMEVHPGIEDSAMFAVLRRCMEERAPQEMENEFTFPDGSKSWFALRFEPEAEGVTIVSVDIAARKRAEQALRRSNRALATLSECNQALVRATDEQQLMHDVCRIAVERGGYRLAWIGLKETDAACSVRLAAHAGHDDGYLDRLRVTWDDTERGQGPTGRAIRTGRSAVARFIATDPEFAPWRRDALERGFASSIALPIRDDGECIGALMMYAVEPDAFDDDEQKSLDEMALDLGYGLTTLRTRGARRHAEEALRLSAARWSATFDAISDTVCVISTDHEFVDINRSGCEAMGLPREMIIGRKCFELVHGSSAPIAACPCKQAALDLKPATTVHEQDGRHYELAAWPILGPNRRMEAFVHVVKEITERKRTDDEIKRKRDALQVIASTLDMSLHDVPLEQVLGKALDGMLSIPWLSLEGKGAVFLVEEDRSRLSMKVARNLSDAVRRSCATVPFGHCLCGRAAASKSLVWSAHLDDRHDTRCLEIEDHGHYCVPIVVERETIGVICTYLSAGHKRRAEEEDLLLAVANALAGVIARRRAERGRAQAVEQLRQSQKLEAIGRLAGGVAHDFNNLLSVIISYAGFAIEGVRQGDPLRNDLEEIRKTGERAASLTRQLLAFSRKQVLKPEVISLNKVIGGMESMLRRLIGEDIELTMLLAGDLGNVMADPGQVEQVTMNLAVNSRDAMPRGGQLTIETSNVELDEAYAERHVAVKPGPYVMISVTDTGSGMDEPTRARIFEPFFTTKGVGKGTGLGLSTVYGIVKQSGGNIFVYSEPGRGTAFKVYLPRELSAAERPERPPPVAASPVGNETILVVEDEEAVRNLAKRILGAAGYTVLTAASGGDALLTCERHGGTIHLVLTDVVMPQMSGRELAERLATVRPELKFLYMSGYTDNAIVHHGVLDPGTNFIGKPFNAVELARRVREVLDQLRVGPS